MTDQNADKTKATYLRNAIDNHFTALPDQNCLLLAVMSVKTVCNECVAAISQDAPYKVVIDLWSKLDACINTITSKALFNQLILGWWEKTEKSNYGRLGSRDRFLQSHAAYNSFYLKQEVSKGNNQSGMTGSDTGVQLLTKVSDLTYALSLKIGHRYMLPVVR